MAISIDWGTRVISIPRNDLTLIQSTPVEIREMNINWFRLGLKDLEDTENGMCFPATHNHNSEVSLGGLTYARVVEIINGYTITFEDGQYAVNLVGANSNIADNVNVNQVSVRSANSAGLTSSPAIEYSSFQNMVTIDTNSTAIGTTYPIGTPLSPVNNLTDAKIIANTRGFNTFYLMSDLTIEDGEDISNFIIKSDNWLTLTLEDTVTCEETIFDKLSLYGKLCGGWNVLKDCWVYDVTNFAGWMREGSFVSIELAPYNAYSEGQSFFDGITPMYPGVPSVLVANTNINVSFTNANDTFEIQSLTAGSEVNIGFSAGKLLLNSSCVGGTVIVSGNGTLENSSQGSVVDQTGLMSMDTVSEAVWDEPLADHLDDGSTGFALMQRSYQGTVFIDVVNGTHGVVYPAGIRQHPVNCIEDALTVASLYELTKLHIIGALSVTSGSLDGFTITSDRSVGNSITLSNVTTNGMYADNITISGTFNGRGRLTYCALGTLVNFDGGIKNSLLTGDITFAGSSLQYLTDCDTFVTTDGQYRTLTIGGCSVNLIRCHGNVQISGKTGSNFTYVGMTAGDVKIDSTCVAGSIGVIGHTELVDESGAGCAIDLGGLMNLATIEKAIWDAEMADHRVSGSTGEALADAGSAGDPWDVSISGYTDPTKFGGFVKTLLTVAKFLGLK